MNLDKKALANIVRNEAIQCCINQFGIYYVPIAISNRHIHLSREHLAILFGNGHALKAVRNLSQPGQFVCDEKVTLIGPKGSIKGVRVLGPERPETQVEIAITDSYLLGVKPVVRMSGDHSNTPGIRLQGPVGEVELQNGVIVSARHLHISTEEAVLFGVKDGDRVKLRKLGQRGLTLENVLVRAGKSHSLEAHIDTDEGNAACIANGDLVILEK